MFRILTAAAVMLAVLFVGAEAQNADRPDSEAGRFILRRVDDGFMRVDRETGATSFCRKRGDAWLCEAVPDDRAALEAEISRLTDDNAELAIEIGRLKERIARLEGDPSRPESDRDDGGADRDDLPSDEELDKVFRTFEGVMRRFMDMARDLRKEYEQDRF